MFIGPQAQGKSVIAKLIYFFKEYPQSILDFIHYSNKEKVEFEQEVLTKFRNIFPFYSWYQSEFSITYSNKYYSISIFHKIHNAISILIEHSKRIENYFLSAKNIKNEIFIPHRDVRSFHSDMAQTLKKEMVL